MFISKEGEDDDNYSPPTSTYNSPLKTGYGTVIENYFEELVSTKRGINYEESINEVLNLSALINTDLQEKHNVSQKSLKKVIWDIFIDLFNTKLKEIHLIFDPNDKQLIKSWFIFDIENHETTKHFYAQYSIPNFDDKESLIFAFLSNHTKNEEKIRFAYVYAFIAS